MTHDERPLTPDPTLDSLGSITKESVGDLVGQYREALGRRRQRRVEVENAEKAWDFENERVRTLGSHILALLGTMGLDADQLLELARDGGTAAFDLCDTPF